MDDKQLDEMENVAKGATPGPWKTQAYNERLGSLITYGDLTKGESVAIAFATVDPATGKANAAYIAAASPDAILSR